MKAAASYDFIYYFAREIGARPAKNWSPCACPAWQGEWKRHVKKESTSLFLSLAVYRLLAVSIVLTMNLIQVQYIQILRRKIQVSSKGVRQTWPPPSLFLSPSLSLSLTIFPRMSPIWVLNHLEVEQKKVLFDQLLVGNDMSLWEYQTFNAWFFSFRIFYWQECEWSISARGKISIIHCMDIKTTYKR